MLMEANRNKVVELMHMYCEGNYNRFAKELKVDPSHLYRYLTTGVGGGKKILGAIMRFCKEKGLSFEEYINL